MELFSKFQRIQWPVGHGGFHTGLLKDSRGYLQYFYDCGAKSKVGKLLIQSKLSGIAFDFGAISHFDRDHYAGLTDATVNVLFLPYMTQSDMFFSALANLAHGMSASDALDGFALLRQLQNAGTQLVMVDGTRPEPDEDESVVSARGDLTLRIAPAPRDADGFQRMSHSSVVTAQRGLTTLVQFKFFNYRDEEASVEFFKQLEGIVKSRRLLKSDSTEYELVDDFLRDVADGDAAMVEANGKALQTLYKDTLGVLGEARAKASNLSSLAMFSRSISHERDIFLTPRWSTWVQSQHFQQELPACDDGWMLTGDLELKSIVWESFEKHYFVELSCCVAFNVPHHGSKPALDEEAIALLKGGKFFLLPVDEYDPDHPAEELEAKLNRHKVAGRQRVTTAWETTFAIVSRWLQK